MIELMKVHHLLLHSWEDFGVVTRCSRRREATTLVEVINSLFMTVVTESIRNLNQWVCWSHTRIHTVFLSSNTSFVWRKSAYSLIDSVAASAGEVVHQLSDVLVNFVRGSNINSQRQRRENFNDRNEKKVGKEELVMQWCPSLHGKRDPGRSLADAGLLHVP